MLRRWGLIILPMVILFSACNSVGSSDVGTAALHACIESRLAAGYRDLGDGTLEGYAFGGTHQEKNFRVGAVTQQTISPADQANTPGLQGLWTVEVDYISRTTVTGGYESWTDFSGLVDVRKRSGQLELLYGKEAFQEQWLPATAPPVEDRNFCGQH